MGIKVSTTGKHSYQKGIIERSHNNSGKAAQMIDDALATHMNNK